MGQKQIPDHSSIGATVITLFDTCYAGGFIGGSNDLNSVPDLTFLGSSTERQESYAYTNQPYSIFTQGLISGLENFNADRDNDGFILASEWFDFSYGYTTNNVSMQHPVFFGDNDLVIVSAHPLPLPSSGLLLAISLIILLNVNKIFFKRTFILATVSENQIYPESVIQLGQQ